MSEARILGPLPIIKDGRCQRGGGRGIDVLVNGVEKVFYFYFRKKKPPFFVNCTLDGNYLKIHMFYYSN